MAHFTVGDVVVLNSGGPQMTVKEVRGQMLLCQWFEKQILREQEFAAAVLSPPTNFDFSAMSDPPREW